MLEKEKVVNCKTQNVNWNKKEKDLKKKKWKKRELEKKKTCQKRRENNEWKLMTENVSKEDDREGWGDKFVLLKIWNE